MLKGSAFPLEPGLNRLTTGTFDMIRGVRGHEESVVTVTTPGGTSTTFTVGAGEDRATVNCQTLEVVSGLVCLMRGTVV